MVYRKEKEKSRNEKVPLNRYPLYKRIILCGNELSLSSNANSIRKIFIILGIEERIYQNCIASRPPRNSSNTESRVIVNDINIQYMKVQVISHSRFTYLITR